MSDYKTKVRPEKAAEVREIAALLERCTAVLLTEYRGLTVGELAALRRELAKADVEYRIVKNTLTRIAARDAGIDGVDDMLEGPTAVAYCFGDPVAAAKAVSAFARDHQSLVLKGAVVDRRSLGADAARDLATVDPRDVSLAKISGLLTAALSQVAATLEAPVSRIAYVLANIGEASAAA